MVKAMMDRQDKNNAMIGFCIALTIATYFCHEITIYFGQTQFNCIDRLYT